MNIDFEIDLFNKPHILSDEFALGVRQCKVESAYQFWDEFRHFHQADIFPNTGPRTVSELYDIT